MRSCQHRVFAEAPGLDQLERVDIDTLLLDARGLGAHRAWRDAADIGVMPARRHEEQNLGAAFGEHRGHHGDVGKMRAAVIGRVQHPHIAGLEIAADLAPHGLDAAVHRAEMHRDMRRVGDEPAVAIEDGAGEVEPLLDVDRARGVLQRIAHLLGNRGEALVEHFEQHWIDAGAERGPRLAFRDAREQQMVLRRDLCLPVRLDHDGLMWLDDEGRAQDAMAWLETGAQENWRVVPGATGEEPRLRLAVREARRSKAACPAHADGRRRQAPRPRSPRSRLAYPDSMKPKRWRCIASNTFLSSARVPSGTGSALSVPR